MLKQNPRLIDQRDDNAATVLHYVIGTQENRGNRTTGWVPYESDERQKMVAFLLEKGADAKAKDKDGVTPLHWAAFNGYENIAKALLAKEAEVKAKDNRGNTPLSLATRAGHQSIVNLLRQRGVTE